MPPTTLPDNFAVKCCLVAACVAPRADLQAWPGLLYSTAEKCWIDAANFAIADAWAFMLAAFIAPSLVWPAHRHSFHEAAVSAALGGVLRKSRPGKICFMTRSPLAERCFGLPPFRSGLFSLCAGLVFTSRVVTHEW